jgi:hypothetical protein
MPESGGIAPPFSTSVLDGGEWSASCPCRFTPSERAPGKQWKRGWFGHQRRFGRYGEKNNLALPGIEPGESSPSLYLLRMGADKSLAFPICSTTKRFFLGWVKEVITTKS